MRLPFFRKALPKSLLEQARCIAAFLCKESQCDVGHHSYNFLETCTHHQTCTHHPLSSLITYVSTCCITVSSLFLSLSVAMAPTFNFHFYESATGSRTTRSSQHLPAALLDKPRRDRRPSRSRSRSRRPQRAPQSPSSQREYGTPVFSYPPQEWFGLNFQSSEATLAIMDSTPGDLRADAAPPPHTTTPPPTPHFNFASLTAAPTTTQPPPTTTTTTTATATTTTTTTTTTIFPPTPPAPRSHNTITASSEGKPAPRVIEPSSSPFKPVAGSLLGFLQRATHASIPPPSSLVSPAPTNLLNDVKLNHKGEAKTFPTQEPSEDDLAYAVRLANSIPLNYDWPALGQVPPSPVPKGLFYPFEFSKLRTMAQRKQYTQEDFERSQQYTAHELT